MKLSGLFFGLIIEIFHGLLRFPTHLATGINELNPMACGKCCKTRLQLVAWDQPATWRPAQEHSRDQKEQFPTALLAQNIVRFLTFQNLVHGQSQSLSKRSSHHEWDRLHHVRPCLENLVHIDFIQPDECILIIAPDLETHRVGAHCGIVNELWINQTLCVGLVCLGCAHLTVDLLERAEPVRWRVRNGRLSAQQPQPPPSRQCDKRFLVRLITVIRCQINRGHFPSDPPETPPTCWHS